VIDRAAVREYDQFVADLAEAPLETCEVALGPWRRARVLCPAAVEPSADEETDVVVLGAGPAGLLLAAQLARRAHRVVVLEARPRLDCGATWNLSHAELAELQATGVFDDALWRRLVVGDFGEGVFRLHDSAAGRERQYAFDAILNVSLDERLFLATLAATPGLDLRLATLAELKAVAGAGVFVATRGTDGVRTLKARLLIDASGWSSRLSALVHPWRRVESVYNMVGVHVRQALQREMGEQTGRPLGLICVTREDEVEGEGGWVQPILERFSGAVPGSSEDYGEVLYYFTRTPRPARLAPVVEEMAGRLPAFVPGFDEALVDRTYFGHGPGYFPERPLARRKIQTSAGDRTLLVGCAAQQYSGLTGCAFGPLARNAGDLLEAVHAALRDDDLSFARLRRIDIDARERVSQRVEGLFGGAMLRDGREKPGCVNRDWIAFCEAAEHMDPVLKNEAFRDKLRLAALNQLLRVCATRPAVLTALLRNNRMQLGLVCWTFISAYLRLLMHEARLLLTRRERKYAMAGLEAVVSSPAYAWNGAALLVRGARTSGAWRRSRKGE
jgi:2-polyprenyl-6-methoxyphenol hydroxylase-like FAD-dependent oxidoreductase